MSKITTALKQVEKERAEFTQQSSLRGRKTMRNSWLIWVFLIAVVATVFFAFNYQGKDSVPLSEIFPDEESYPVDIEYEFVDNVEETAQVVTEKVEDTAQIVQAKAQEAKAGIKQQSAQVKKEIQTITQEVKQVAKPVPSVTSQFLNETQVSQIPFTIQVASFRKQTRAQQMLDELKSKNYSQGFVASKNLGEKGVWYRVYVGQFKSKDEAQSYLTTFKKDYKDSFVISPK